MIKAVVFVEEESARIVVESIAKRVAPGATFQIISHEGRSDLRDSFPRKMRAWRFPANVPFILIHDNDGGNCLALKSRLVRLVPEEVLQRVKVRIVMQSLECWYLGDPNALVRGGLITDEKMRRAFGKAKFRTPELLTNAKDEFLRLHGEVGQMNIARKVAPHLSLEGNRCQSFSILIETLRNLR